MQHARISSWIVIAVLFVIIISAANPIHALSNTSKERSNDWQTKMSFANAANPYSEEKLIYNVHCAIGPKGDFIFDEEKAITQKPGLGCSGYTNVVLHRMRYGQDWLKHWNTAIKVDGKFMLRRELHQKWGDVLPRTLGLGMSAKVHATKLINQDEIKKLLKNETLKPNALYYFDVRGKNRDGEDRGHVGFLRVKEDGSLVQSHYSGVARYNGLATGDPTRWIKGSLYRNRLFSLYLVPEKE